MIIIANTDHAFKILKMKKIGNVKKTTFGIGK